MLSKRITLALCAGLLGLGACAHDTKARERTTASAEEAAGDQVAAEATRQHNIGTDSRGPRGTNEVQAPEPMIPATSGTESASAGQQPAQGAPTAAASGTNREPSACELAVYFDTDSARLDSGSQQRLDKVAECMKRREIDHAMIVGQTDPSGTEEHNRKLGLERAKAVAEYLRGRGVPEGQIRVRSKGEMAAATSQELWPVERRAGVDVK